MKLQGQLGNLEVKLNGKMKPINSLIIKGDRAPHIGRQWLAEFDTWTSNSLLNIKNSKKSKNAKEELGVNDTKEKLITEFQTLFDGTRGVPNKKQMILWEKPNIKPYIRCKARDIRFEAKARRRSTVAIKNETLRERKFNRQHALSCSKEATVKL